MHAHLIDKLEKLRKVRNMSVLLKNLTRSKGSVVSTCVNFNMWTCYLFCFGAFAALTGIWKYGDPIECINQFGMEPTNQNIERLCLKFGYLNIDKEKKEPGLADPYAYIHYVLICCGLLHLLLKVFVLWNSNRYLDNTISGIRTSPDTEGKEKIFLSFLEQTRGGVVQNILIWRILNTVFMLFANCVTFFVINHLYSGFYLKLEFLERQRDFHFFNDGVSLRFPSFIECTLDEKFHFYNTRRDVVKCELFYNYFLEKFLIVLGFWLVFVALLTMCSFFWELSFICRSSRQWHFMKHNRKSLKRIPSEAQLPLVLVRKHLTNETFQTGLELCLNLYKEKEKKTKEKNFN